MAQLYPNAIGDLIAHSLQSARRARAGHRARPRPTGSRVHANSQMYVGMEGSFWRPISARNARRMVRAAVRFDERGRQADRRDRTRKKNGPLGHIGIEVLEAMLSLVDFATGALFPGFRTLARRTGRCVAAVHAAVDRLCRHGFLEKRRRIEPTGERGIRGPQVRQASNAYSLKVPAELHNEVFPPAPEDDVWRRQEVAQEHCRMVGQENARIDALDPEEAAYAIVGGRPGDNPLADALASLGRQIKRDSAMRNESPEVLS